MSGIPKGSSRVLGKFGTGPFRPRLSQSGAADWPNSTQHDIVRFGPGLPQRPARICFWGLTGCGVVRTPKLSELEAGAIPGWVTPWEVAPNSEVKRVGGWSNPRMGDHPGKLLRELPETKPCGLVRM
ncbi:hypothetical protein L3X38_043844 [Prunus dulcis]|uniref:Uncharacterized protein n=1 Tax=Prunus dulcis TaxID=3755 RepID=A0AAD4UYK3_PRUDU|nr:hypothetical protein L3X38_043844 [Prunus dulcis]